MSQTNRRNTLKGLLMTLGAAVLPGCASTGTAPPIQQGDTATALAQLDAFIRQQLRRHSGANLSVAVLDGDRLAWAGGYGTANPARLLPATEHTRYRAGSISKVFTAMAALQLAEQGRLDLDAPLLEALPAFRLRSRFAGGKPVTPRLILRHRAGLPTDWAQGMWSDTPAPFSGLVEQLQNQYLAAPPDQLYAYSNVGFTLLGAAIQHITGEPFARHMQEQLLGPMGMLASAFEIGPPSGPLAALAFNEKGQVESEPGLRDMPAGGLNTSAVDLLQLARLWFAQGTLNGRPILSARSIAAMQTPPPALSLADAATMGLGWHLLDDELDGVGPLLWHSGGTPHHHAQLMLLPQQRLAVAVMSSSVTAGELVHDTALQALALMTTARTGTHPVRPLRQGADPAHPPAALPAYAGHYDTPMGVVRIDATDRQATVNLGGQQLPLAPQPDGYLKLQVRILGLIPVNLGTLGEVAFNRHDTADGQAWLLARRKGRFALVGTRLDPLPIPPAWQRRLGTYRYDGTDPFLAAQMGSVRLLEDAGLLLAEVEAGPESTRMALAPVDDVFATVRGLGRSRGDTVQAVDEGGSVVLLYSGMRLLRQAAA